MKNSLIAAALTLGFGAAQALTLDFGNGPSAPVICAANADGSGALVGCSNSGFINQAHGDVAGVVDVSYAQPLQASPMSLRWWAADYNSLYGVLWADGGDGPASHASISLQALGAGGIALTHFDLGAYPHTSRPTVLDVYDMGSNLSVFHFEGTVGAEPAPTAFNLNLWSATGLRIEWRNTAYNVGIDNIEFQAAPIPEPASYALMLGGLGLLAGLARRRR